MLIEKLCSSIESIKDGLAGYVASIANVEGNPNQILIKEAADAAASAVSKGLTDVIDAICEKQSLDDICDILAYISSVTGALGNGLRSVSWLAPPLRAFAEGLVYLSLVAKTAEVLLERIGKCPKPVEPTDPAKDPPTSPLIIDLNGDGVQTIALEQSQVFFDLNGDGFAQHTAWASPEDGLLALDRNANGTIDDISELFGSSTQDGFTELRQLDSNGDGVIDAADAAFNDLRVWIDANSDGISQSEELKTLVEAGITLINLSAQIVDVQNSGNPVTHESTATTSTGATVQVLDVWFRNSVINTKFNLPEGFEYSADALLLPQLQGYGQVGDLRYALSTDAGLLGAVNALLANINGKTGAEFRSEFESILLQWAGVTDVDPASRGDYIDARHLVMLERMFATDFLQTLGTNAGTPDPGPNAALELEQAYQDLLDSMLTRFSVQVYVSQLQAFDGSGDAPQPGAIEAIQATLDSPFRNLSELYYSPHANAVTTRDATSALATALGDLPADPAQAIAQIDLVVTALAGLRVDLFNGDETAYRAALGGALAATPDLALRELAIARASELDELVVGTAAGEAIAVPGVAYRPDSAELRPDANGLWGREGDDTLTGGFGGDSYIFTAGDGADVVDDQGAADRLEVDDWGVFVNFGGRDQVLLVGRSSLDAVLTHSGEDLVIGFTDGSGDSVTLRGQFAVDDAGQIERLVFADTIIEQAELEATFALQPATSGNDDLLGSALGDSLTGGLGDDTLNGRAGDDFYSYSSGGDGFDLIIDRGGDAGDELRFSDLTSNDVVVQRDGADVLILVPDPSTGLATGSVRLVDEFSGDNVSGLEIVSFSDGAQWSLNDLVIESAGGLPLGPAIVGGAASETLNGTAAGEIFDGGAGNDTINPGGGVDIIRFGQGSGRDVLQLSRVDRFAEINLVETDAALDHLALSRSGDDLLIELLQDVVLPDGSTGLQASGDSLVVAGHFLADNTRLDRLVLAGGEVLDSDEIDRLAVPDKSVLHLAGVTLADLSFSRVDAPADRPIERSYGNTDMVISANGVVLATVESQFFERVDANGDPIRFGVERVTLDDGSVFDRDALARLTPVLGSEFNDNGSISSVDGAVHRPLLGSSLGEELTGLAGNDILRGGAGDDSLTGGAGDDRLTGDGDFGQLSGAPREGSDSYFYAGGDGNDRIFDFGSGGIDVDRLVLSDLTAAEVTLSRVAAPVNGRFIEGRNAELVITVAASGETIAVNQQFVNEFYGLEIIQFADGSQIDRASFLNIAPLLGGAGDDVVTGGGLIRPGLGDDVVFGVALPGYETTLDYSQGDGNDELSDVEVIRFADLNASDLRFIREGGDLRIEVIANGQSILIFGQFSSTGGFENGEGPLPPANGGVLGDPGGALPGDPGAPGIPGGPAFVPPLSRIEFADGGSWDAQQIEAAASVTGSAADDFIEGSADSDQIVAGAGNDTVTALAGDDSLTGGSGNDSLAGGPGLDRFFAGSEGGGADGADTIDGGADDDRYDASAVATAVNIDLAAGTATGADIGSDQLVSIEEAYGGGGDDTLAGNDGRNILSGGAGNDSLLGAGGVDLLIGGKGADTLEGGAGLDVALYDRSLAGVEVDLQTGIGLGGDAEGDQLSGVEDLLGSNYADIFYGDDLGNGLDLNRGDDLAFGQGGDDTINGEAGHDTLWGGAGNDVLIGEVGDDSITGGAGNDTIDGGSGNDQMAGGAGSDIYSWSAGSGIDRIDEGASAASDVDQLNLYGLLGDEIVLNRRANDLFITTGNGDELFIPGQFSGVPGAGIERLDFVDGQLLLDRAGIAAAAVTRNNIAPFAVDDALAATAGEQLLLAPQEVLGNDQDLDRDTLQLLSVANAANGSVQLLNDGSIAFVADVGFSGETSFTYTVGDGAGGTATATAFVEVAPSTLTQGGAGNDRLVGSAGAVPPATLIN